MTSLRLDPDRASMTPAQRLKVARQQLRLWSHPEYRNLVGADKLREGARQVIARLAPQAPQAPTEPPRQAPLPGIPRRRQRPEQLELWPGLFPPLPPQAGTQPKA